MQVSGKEDIARGMSPKQRKSIERTIEHENEKYEKAGSSYRAYFTNDPSRPIGLMNLKDESFPASFREQFGIPKAGSK